MGKRSLIVQETLSLRCGVARKCRTVEDARPGGSASPRTVPAIANGGASDRGREVPLALAPVRLPPAATPPQSWYLQHAPGPYSRQPMLVLVLCMMAVHKIAGVDATFRAPKLVSALSALSGSTTRSAVEMAHELDVLVVPPAHREEAPSRGGASARIRSSIGRGRPQESPANSRALDRLPSATPVTLGDERGGICPARSARACP
jgi:hypothetical protein